MKKFLFGVATGYMICSLQAAYADGAFDRAAYITRQQKEGVEYTPAEVFNFIVYKTVPRRA